MASMVLEAPRCSWVQVHAGPCTLGGALYIEFSSALAGSKWRLLRSLAGSGGFWSDVVPHAHVSAWPPKLQHFGPPEVGDCIFGFSSEQGIAEVQSRCHKGMNNPFTRVSVQKPPDPANILNVVRTAPTDIQYSHGGPWSRWRQTLSQGPSLTWLEQIRESPAITWDTEIFYSIYVCHEPWWSMYAGLVPPLFKWSSWPKDVPHIFGFGETFLSDTMWQQTNAT